MYGRTYGRAIFSQPKFLGCLGNQILLPMVKSNPVNTDTEGAIDSFLKNGVSVKQDSTVVRCYTTVIRFFLKVIFFLSRPGLKTDEWNGAKNSESGSLLRYLLPPRCQLAFISTTLVTCHIQAVNWCLRMPGCCMVQLRLLRIKDRVRIKF